MYKLLFSLIFLITTFSLSAQFEPHSKFDIGLIAGPSDVFVHSFDYKNRLETPTVYFAAGFTAQYHFPKIMSLVTGLYFDKKGYRFDEAIAINSNNILVIGHIRSSYNYISLPLMLRATFGKKVGFFINAGGYASALINVVDKVSESDDPNTVKKSTYTSSYHPVDFGISAGAGLLIPISEKLLFSCEVRNNTGLYNIRKFAAGSSIKTSATSMMIGVVYRLKKKNA